MAVRASRASLSLSLAALALFYFLCFPPLVCLRSCQKVTSNDVRYGKEAVGTIHREDTARTPRSKHLSVQVQTLFLLSERRYPALHKGRVNTPSRLHASTPSRLSRGVAVGSRAYPRKGSTCTVDPSTRLAHIYGIPCTRPCTLLCAPLRSTFVLLPPLTLHLVPPSDRPHDGSHAILGRAVRLLAGCSSCGFRPLRN